MMASSNKKLSQCIDPGVEYLPPGENVVVLPNPIPVVVTTKQRNVFFGFVDPSEIKRRSLTLTKCRHCIVWTADVRGYLGLASHGPSETCRITRTSPRPVLLHDVLCVAECSDEAVERWMKAE